MTNINSVEVINKDTWPKGFLTAWPDQTVTNVFEKGVLHDPPFEHSPKGSKAGQGYRTNGSYANILHVGPLGLPCAAVSAAQGKKFRFVENLNG